MEELTHLMYNVVEAGSFLQESGRHHGDIRPSQIILTKKGVFKLGDRLNDPTPAPRNQFNNIVSGKDLYMSPVLYSALKKHNFKVSHNGFKSDVFSLGLCILEAGLIRPLDQIFDDSASQISFPALKGFIQEFGDKYNENPLLVTTLGKMLEMNEASRPDFINIKGAIPPYSDILEYFERGDDSEYYEEDFTDPHRGAHNNGHPQHMNMPPHAHQMNPVPPHYNHPPQHRPPQNHNQVPPNHNPHQNINIDPYSRKPAQDFRQAPASQNYSHSNSQNSMYYQREVGGNAMKDIHGFDKNASQNLGHTSGRVNLPHHNKPSSQYGGTKTENTGKTKIIEGKLYREVREERTEVNEKGQSVKRVYIRYIPSDENDHPGTRFGNMHQSTETHSTQHHSMHSQHNVPTHSHNASYNQGGNPQ